MSGTKDGGYTAKETILKRYGADYYQRIGSKGGKLGRTGGFFANRLLASTAGALGGAKSRRSKQKSLKKGCDTVQL